MIIKFTGEHKSLKDFDSDILDPFAVITGKNGCGKSQLIEIIALKSSNKLTPLMSLEFEPKVHRIQIEGIENSNLAPLNNSSWKSKVDKYLNDFKKFGDYSKQLAELLLQNETWLTELNGNSILKSITSVSPEVVEELVTNSLKEIDPNWFAQTRTFPQVEKRIKDHKKFNEVKRKTSIVSSYVSKYREKNISELNDGDFYLTPIPEYFLDEPKLFGSQLEFVFYNYAKRRDQNQRLFFEKETYKDRNDSISDHEFVKKFVPPWTSINEILEQHNLQFQFKGIERQDFTSDASISFQLVKTTIGKDIEFQHLSSGEKVIIGLIIKLFTSQYYNDKLEFPELIVLDEPDAYLHPEMSKLLIDVLNGTFVQKLGIKVIFVSHSPSTIALCPDNSIYQLKNEPITSLKRIEKDEALEILTEHLPTLSIDYKNHKQVFVESPTDIIYYQTIFNKLNQINKYPNRLYFISNSYGKGSCEQVIKIIEDIRSSGNRTSFGIIDWDLKNKTSDFIKVHGEHNRYNVENYLYDPVYIAILLMNLKAHNVYTDLGIDETVNHYSIGNESNEYLQKISDWFFQKYYNEFTIDEKKKEELVEIIYLNDRKINVPKWYLTFSGHDFETRIKKVFPALSGRYTSEGELQKEISLIVGKCFPFIPKDSELLIEEIIKSG